jgi:ubiquinone/menaquinone biosynthesis C-methylase UbiE
MREKGIDEVRRVYDGLGGRYDRFTRLLDASAVTTLRRNLLGGARGRLLEVAVGTGKNLRYLPPDCALVGVDLSEEMLRVARERAAELGRTLETHRLDATQLPFESNSFETVVCTLAGCTFADPLAVFREMRRVCTPDGAGLFLEHVRPKSRVGQWLMQGITPLTTRLLGCHPNRDTMATLREAGWRLDELHTAVGDLFVAARMSPAS